MQEFYALSSSQATDVMEEQSTGKLPAIPQNQNQQAQVLPLQIILFGNPSGSYVGGSPIHLTPAGTPTTEPLTSISNASPAMSAAPSLIAALQSPMSSDMNRPRVIIPGSRKRDQIDAEKTEQNAASSDSRRLTPRIRHSIIFGTIVLVVITTLLTLTPLSNGQLAFSFTNGISNWFRTGELTWQIQAHMDANSVSSNASTVSQNVPAGPPMILPKSAYVAIAEQDAVNAGISPQYFVRQINQESSFNPYAVSPAGAVGIAQFEPGTAAGLGVNPWDPVSALNGAAHLMANYANSYGGDYAKALAAYNGGTGTVQYAVNACGANWLNCLPGQTRNYIYVIMGI